MANVRQVIDGAFYFFGVVMFLNLQTIIATADHSKTPIYYYILQNFIFDCSLAAGGFLVLLVMHLTQWFVTARINACARSMKAI
jgi:hypothetical protein